MSKLNSNEAIASFEGTRRRIGALRFVLHPRSYLPDGEWYLSYSQFRQNTSRFMYIVGSKHFATIVNSLFIIICIACGMNIHIFNGKIVLRQGHRPVKMDAVGLETILALDAHLVHNSRSEVEEIPFLQIVFYVAIEDAAAPIYHIHKFVVKEYALGLRVGPGGRVIVYIADIGTNRV